MAWRAEAQLFIGRLSKNTRTRDLEDVFEVYGKLTRCDIKFGAEMAYAFLEYEDRRDAEDAMRHENGRDVCGSSIVVEWAKGGNARRGPMRERRDQPRSDECFKCHRSGHWARDCPEERYGNSGGGGGGGGGRSFSPNRRRRSRSRDRRRRSRSRSRSRDRARDASRSRSRSRSPEERRAGGGAAGAGGRFSRSRSRDYGDEQ